MIEHTVNSYERELELLNHSVVEMGKVVHDILVIAAKAIVKPDSELIEQAKSTDRQINALDGQIESKAVTIIALRQPMAIDLRMVISALRLAVIMERMGDLAKNTVKRTEKFEAKIPEKFLKNIVEMININIKMLDLVLQSYSKLQNEEALLACEADDLVDQYYKDLNDSIQKYMAENPKEIPSMMQVLYAIKNIERIGDYVTKVAKILHFVVTGEKAPKIKKSA